MFSLISPEDCRKQPCTSCLKQGSSYLDKAGWKTGRNKEREEETQGIYLVKSQRFSTKY